MDAGEYDGEFLVSNIHTTTEAVNMIVKSFHDVMPNMCNSKVIDDNILLTDLAMTLISTFFV